MIEHALYVIATPIGNLSDITFRAVETLKQVALIAAEDTRYSKRLLQHFTITTPMLSLHEYNEEKQANILIQRLLNGASIGLISDSGTPLISDPGFNLVQRAIAVGIRVIPIPGPSALIAALSVAGVSPHQFIFAGFLSAKKEARRKQISAWQYESRTIVCYEAPHRIIMCLEDIGELLGPDRYVVIARELTKKFETVHGDCIAKLLDWMKSDSCRELGEFVLLIGGTAVEKQDSCEIEVNVLMTSLLAELPLNQAVKLAVKLTGMKKNGLYQLALTIANNK